MYKAKQSSGAKLCSPAGNVRKSNATPLPSIHKENLLDTNVFGGADGVTVKFAFKSTVSRLGNAENQSELKLTQPLRSPRQSRRKLPKPWVAKPLDLNTDTIRPEKIRPSLEKCKEIGHEKRGSMKQSLQKTKQLSFYCSEIRGKEELIETVRFAKAVSTREKEPYREKTGACRIALKKSVFPLSQRQYQQQKVVQHFQKEEDMLSTIPKFEDSERFISIESYSNLNLVF